MNPVQWSASIFICLRYPGPPCCQASSASKALSLRGLYMGLYRGLFYGVIKGDTRSLDYSSIEHKVLSIAEYSSVGNRTQP